MRSRAGSATGARKVITFHRIHYDIHPPYTVIADSETLHHALSNNLYLKQAIPSTLCNVPAHLTVTACTVSALRSHGNSHSSAALFAKRLHRTPCLHNDGEKGSGEQKITETECIQRILQKGSIRLIVTKASEITMLSKQIPGVLLIAIDSQNRIVVRSVSKASLQHVEQRKHDSAGGAVQLNDADKALIEKVKEEERIMKKRRRDEIDGHSRRPMKRKRAKGPNPLSMKKSRKDSGQNEVGDIHSNGDTGGMTNGNVGGENEEEKKGRRRRRRSKSKTVQDGAEAANMMDAKVSDANGESEQRLQKVPTETTSERNNETSKNDERSQETEILEVKGTDEGPICKNMEMGATVRNIEVTSTIVMNEQSRKPQQQQSSFTLESGSTNVADKPQVSKPISPTKLCQQQREKADVLKTRNSSTNRDLEQDIVNGTANKPGNVTGVTKTFASINTTADVNKDTEVCKDKYKNKYKENPTEVKVRNGSSNRNEDNDTSTTTTNEISTTKKKKQRKNRRRPSSNKKKND